jgi:hypothetical protein
VDVLRDLPEGARRIDPLAEAERLGRHRRPPAACDFVICDGYHLAGSDEMACFVRITLTADRSFPVRPDLGERIADLIRADLERESGG